MKLEKIVQAKKILIYGYGVEGKSSENFLRKVLKSPKSPLTRGLDGRIFIFDENLDITSPSQTSGTPLKLRGDAQQIFLKKGNFEFSDFDVIVVSAGIPRRKIPENLQDRGTSNVEIFFENLSENQRKKVIGITGSKGKSTTCQFLNELLLASDFSSRIIGNFGVPFLDAVEIHGTKINTSPLRGTPLCKRGDTQDFELLEFEEDFLVAEFSSYQLENLKISPHLALFTSFFSEHLSFHETNENYLKAKQNLWRFQKKGDKVFTQEYLAPLVDENFSYDIEDYFGKKSGKKKYSEQIIYSKEVSENLFPESSVLRAEHFRGNLGIVWSLCKFLKIKNLEKIWKKVAENFKIIPHRLEFFEEKRGIKFYDDSISTNSEATIAAIRFFQEKLGCLIIGGQKDSSDGFDLLLDVLMQKSPEVFVILLKSESGNVFKESAVKFKFKNFLEADSLEEAVKFIFEKTEKNKVCVLSPAGKSFDWFKHYKERGDKFKEFVRTY